MQMAQTSVENAARRAATSLMGMKIDVRHDGLEGLAVGGLCVVATEPMVRPWKLCSSAMNFVPIVLPSVRSRPAWARASLSAASQASVPELQRKTRSRPVISVRRSASSVVPRW